MAIRAHRIGRVPAAFLSGLAILVAWGAAAGEPAPAANAEREPSVIGRANLAERTENLGRVYRSETNPWIQEIWFLGRYHGQYYESNGSVAQDEDWEHRRLRIGGQARLFDRLVLHVQMVSKEDVDAFYGGFTELWVGWRFHDALILTIGQQKHRFTHDRNISSRYLNTLERSQLTNMFALDYTPAITLSGRGAKWTYYGGIFSNATDPDMSESFGEFRAGASFMAIGTYDLSALIPTDSAFLNGGYLYSDANRRATNLNRYEHGFATALILTEGPLSLTGEVTAGFGYEQGDSAGINVQPGWFMTDEVQFVGRYTLAASDGRDGLISQRRYEREVGLTTGDLHQASYLGLNYYVLRHRLKLMGGVEYARIGGEEALTASFAVRLFWGPQSAGPFPMAGMLEGSLEPD